MLRVRDRSLTALESAVVEAACYTDAFDWPLTPDELHRSLPVPADRLEVAAALRSPRVRPLLSTTDGYVHLAGRESLIARRRSLARTSRRLWPRAMRSAQAIARLPFVRLVGVTGSLAVNAAAEDADVDLFIVTADDRLWLTRAMAIGVVRVGAAAGIHLCPNYLLAESSLELPPSDRDRFTAYELANLVPIAGRPAYEQLLEANAWYRQFLPNHRPPTPPRSAAGNPAAEALLRGRPIDRLERWEMTRKVARLSAGTDAAGAAASPEARFGPTVCKGHFEGHRRRALAAFEERLAAVLGEEAAA